MGNIFHHATASLLICLLVTGVAKPDPSVLDPILILCMQHAVSLVRYWSWAVYASILLLLEVWFQWTTMACMELYVENHWTVVVCAVGMMFAHLIWMFTAAYKMFSRMMYPMVAAPLATANKESPVLKEQLEKTLSRTKSDTSDKTLARTESDTTCQESDL